MIVIVDYQMGNPGSIQNMIKRIGFTCVISSDVSDIKKATKLIMPGVGTFDRAIQNLRTLGIFDLIDKKVMIENTPILGICLGMQLLTKRSEEGTLPGFGWIDAETLRFKNLPSGMKVPHMGWNMISKTREHPLFSKLDEDARFYFVHSFYVNCASIKNSLARTTYGTGFDSAIVQDQILGVQFHPEKSHKYGMQLFKNFVEL